MVLPIYFLSAIWLGFIVAVPPGAVTVIGVQYALRGNFKKTLTFIAGSSLADCFYLFLVYAGLAAVMSADSRFKVVLYFISGCLFVYIGIHTLADIWKKRKDSSSSSDLNISVDNGYGVSDFIKGVAVTLTNPTTVVGWLAVGGNFFLLWRGRWEASRHYEIPAIVFIMIGVELWFIPMLFFIHKTHKRIKSGTQSLLMIISALIIIAMGLSALWFGMAEVLKV